MNKMLSTLVPPPECQLTPAEFEGFARQVAVSWTWQTIGGLRNHAHGASNGIAHEGVSEKGLKTATVVCITNPEEIARCERVLGKATESKREWDWDRTTLFEAVLRTALEGGFLFESARNDRGERTMVVVCATGKKGMRVVESLFPLPVSASHDSDNQESKFARAEAAEIIARLALPENLTGRTINFVAFQNDEDCNFFHPGRSCRVHEQIFDALKIALVWRGVNIARSILTPKMFTDAGRYAGNPADWADRRNFLVPVARGETCAV